jgi:hypothetical protein
LFQTNKNTQDIILTSRIYYIKFTPVFFNSISIDLHYSKFEAVQKIKKSNSVFSPPQLAVYLVRNQQVVLDKYSPVNWYEIGSGADPIAKRRPAAVQIADNYPP